MTTRQQILRSSTPGQVPAANTRLPGEMWTTFPDLQLGVIDASKVAQKLIAVRYFSTTANYAIGDFVVQAGALYVATAAVTPGAFNAANWSKIVNAADAAALPYLPLAGGTITGLLILPNNNQVQIRGAASTLRNILGATAASPRWVLTLGDGTAEAGANAGSNFSLQAYSDAGGFLSTPLAINRATGVATFGAAVMLSGPPTLALQAATKAYVDSGAFVPIAGNVAMTGPLTLAANPAAPLQPATKQYVDAVPLAMNDNRLINGDMRIDQRNNGASGTANNVYTVDRWRYGTPLVAKGTWQRITAGPTLLAWGFGYFYSFTSSSAYVVAAGEFCRLHQIIEADMIADFAWGTVSAQPITLSFIVASSLTGTFGGSLTNDTGTRSYPFTFSIPTAGIYTKVAITIPGDTVGPWVLQGNAAGLTVQFDLGSGATYRAPANAWASGNYVGANGAVSLIATNGATFNLTGVKLEIGSTATPFNRQSLAKSLADCQRYYQKLGGDGVPSILLQGYGGAGSGAACTIGINAMRAAPTATSVGSPALINATGPSLNPGLQTLALQVITTATGVFSINYNTTSTYITLAAEL